MIGIAESAFVGIVTRRRVGQTFDELIEVA